MIDDDGVKRAKHGADHWLKTNIHKVREQLAQCDLDVYKERRLADTECKYCFYFRRGMVVTQAFTRRNCEWCETEFQWPNGGIPKLCADCAQKHQACRRCYAGLNYNIWEPPEPIKKSRRKRP